jgi:hypothetical protein
VYTNFPKNQIPTFQKTKRITIVNKHFTIKEEDTIIQMYNDNYAPSIIAKELGRTYGAIVSKAKRLRNENRINVNANCITKTSKYRIAKQYLVSRYKNMNITINDVAEKLQYYHDVIISERMLYKYQYEVNKELNNKVSL